jgi:hypothetical protein
MSTIESAHARPAMTDLIIGKTEVPISQSQANSIAIFAFKSAVVFDHTHRGRNPFFDQEARSRFRESLLLPENINMWLAAFTPPPGGCVRVTYLKSKIGTPEAHSIEMNVCTYSVGYLVLQVVCKNGSNIGNFRPKVGFEHLSVPLWPRVRERFV